MLCQLSKSTLQFRCRIIKSRRETFSAAFVRTLPRFLVGVTGFEPAKSLGPKPSAIPNFATPRWLFSYGRRCGQTCGQRRFFDGFMIFCDGRKRRCVNGSRRWRVCERRESVHAPKPSALPTALHLDCGLPDKYSIFRVGCQAIPAQKKGHSGAEKMAQPELKGNFRKRRGSSSGSPRRRDKSCNPGSRRG